MSILVLCNVRVAVRVIANHFVAIDKRDLEFVSFHKANREKLNRACQKCYLLK